MVLSAVICQDMNEPANFGTNNERPWNWPEDHRPYWSLQCPEGKFDDPPYRTSEFFSHIQLLQRGTGWHCYIAVILSNSVPMYLSIYLFYSMYVHKILAAANRRVTAWQRLP